jgi:hypothetical protein
MSTFKKSVATERLLTTTITISKQDQAYLNRMVAALKQSHPKANRSELIALGVALLRQKTPQEIEDLLSS